MIKICAESEKTGIMTELFFDNQGLSSVIVDFKIALTRRCQAKQMYGRTFTLKHGAVTD